MARFREAAAWLMAQAVVAVLILGLVASVSRTAFGQENLKKCVTA
jgi:hypothetical protein